MANRTLSVDVTDLAETMDFAMAEGLHTFLDLRTGALVHPDEPEEAEEAEEDEDLLPIPAFEPSYRYGRMLKFAAQVDRELGELLAVALEGQGAFRRFKNIINQRGIADAWYAFQLELDRAEAMAWLASEGITAVDVSTRMPAIAPDPGGDRSA
jgi:hypothetical protein